MSTGQFVSRCTADAMSSAATSIKDGNLVAFPTETVYGLGADASNPEAVAKIYRAKGRPADHPLIVHIGSMDGIGYWADEISEYAIALARTFWPGPMTLICKRSPEAKDFITGGQDTVGLRVPDHVVAIALLDAPTRPNTEDPTAAPKPGKARLTAIEANARGFSTNCVMFCTTGCKILLSTQRPVLRRSSSSPPPNK